MHKLVLALLIVSAAFSVYLATNRGYIDAAASEAASPDAQRLADAFEHRQSDLQVRGSGVVIRMLSDDVEGSRHQRFIVEMSSGQTLLIAHNIDLAPRIDGLRVGDQIEFFGEYEWNAKGGVVHWTHHDPAGRHTGGWLRHQGKTYQ
ncbi:DUF3465 domain-containing protein [Marinobacterium litorale]|uniref:DUF3465 domain-containing protein n=1 Tax=Marinobacterium litorale TaxID=404770 RepID=UPI00041671C0|nr:DUF3465 domain-containing protein [Marinobacterium litorale]